MQDEASLELLGSWVVTLVINARVTKKDCSYASERLFDDKVEQLHKSLVEIAGGDHTRGGKAWLGLDVVWDQWQALQSHFKPILSKVKVLEPSSLLKDVESVVGLNTSLATLFFPLLSVTSAVC